MRLHDLALDPLAGGHDAFTARTYRNAELRATHHHVFDTYLALGLIDRAGFEIAYADVQLPWHIAVGSIVEGIRDPLVEASPANEVNARWLEVGAPCRRSSPSRVTVNVTDGARMRRPT